jgi:putative oxidoreductase
MTEGGYEYNAVLIAAMVEITERGPGSPSVDEALFPDMHGPGWALLQLAAGAIGSVVTTDERFMPAAEEERFSHDAAAAESVTPNP